MPRFGADTGNAFLALGITQNETIFMRVFVDPRIIALADKRRYDAVYVQIHIHSITGMMFRRTGRLRNSLLCAESGDLLIQYFLLFFIRAETFQNNQRFLAALIRRKIIQHSVERRHSLRIHRNIDITHRIAFGFIVINADVFRYRNHTRHIIKHKSMRAVD